MPQLFYSILCIPMLHQKKLHSGVYLPTVQLLFLYLHPITFSMTSAKQPRVLGSLPFGELLQSDRANAGDSFMLGFLNDKYITVVFCRLPNFRRDRLYS